MNKPTRAQVLETFTVFAAVCQLAAIYSQRQIFSSLALALLAVALLIKPLAEAATMWWLKFSAILSAMNNRILLTLLFYLVLTPIAIIYRLFNKDTLRLDMSDSDSCYTERNHTYAKADLEKMW
jgi:saxitoxin biosynthesis operon SxtJ-like protein